MLFKGEGNQKEGSVPEVVTEKRYTKGESLFTLQTRCLMTLLILSDFLKCA